MSAQSPVRPNIEQLKNQAREFLNALKQGDADAHERLRTSHPQYADRDHVDARPDGPVLADALLVLARELGFPTWVRFKRFVEDLDRVDGEAKALREAFSQGDEATREKVREAKEPWFRKDSYERPEPDADLTDHDARVIVANDHGYARWDKYESFLHLEPNVRDVIEATRVGDLARVQAILAEDHKAANPHWVPGFQATPRIGTRGANRSGFDPGQFAKLANDSVPLFLIGEGIFAGQNERGNDYKLAKALLDAGADPVIAGHLPMTSACSFNAPGMARALLEAGAPVDGPGGHGICLCYALFFGFTELSELLATHGAKTDLRFVAGLGRLNEVKSYFDAKVVLKDGAGDLADPYRGEADTPHNAPRTPELILQQALMFACLHGRLEVAEFLLDHGADVSRIITGLDVNCTVMHRLTELNTFGATARKEDVEELRLPVVRFLLERGYDREVRDQQHDATALAWAKEGGADRVAALLSQ